MMIKKLADDLMSAFFRFRNFSGEYPEDLGVKMPELFALKMLAKKESGGKCCSSVMGEIRDELNVSKPAISGLMSSLEKKGLVTREIDKSDRRRVDVGLTPDGKDAISKAKAYHSELLEDAIQTMGEDKAHELIKLLNLFSDSLSEANKNKTGGDVK
jgi:DNA-binding MarR family transcriptional regulator